jgi:hypothetical protein
MVAIDRLLLLQTPPEVALVSVTELPTQRFPVVLIADGEAFTVAVTVALLEHPLLLVPVTVYVVVTEGLAVMVAPIVADNPVGGVHV